MFDKRTHCVSVSVVAHVLVVVVVLSQPHQLKLAPIKQGSVRVTSARRTEPLWMLASIDRPAPAGPAPTGSQKHSGIVREMVVPAEQSRTAADDAVPPVDNQAKDIG